MLMELRQLCIRNFRGIAQSQLDNLRPVVLIVGPNGSAKTSLLEAILLLGGRKNPGLVFPLQDQRGLGRVISSYEANNNA